QGNEISGVWIERYADNRTRRAAIQGWIDSSTVTLLKRYGSGDDTATFVSSELSSDYLRGTWQSPGERGPWRAAWRRKRADRSNEEPRDDCWHSRLHDRSQDESRRPRPGDSFRDEYGRRLPRMRGYIFLWPPPQTTGGRRWPFRR